MKNFFGRALTQDGPFLVNATPHPINFLVSGKVISLENSPEIVPMLGAVPKKEKYYLQPCNNTELVKTKFVPTEEGREFINNLEKHYPRGSFLIVGSIISAQAYGFPVVSLVPVPGTERSKPADKMYLPDEFNAF